MEILYIPKGPAKEYALLGLNIYKGCTHGCKYCYCANQRYIEKEEYFSAPNPKLNVLTRLHQDCDRLLVKYRPNEIPEILLSFLGDVYQPAEMGLKLTRRAIEILIAHDLTFTILTKGGQRALRDLDLLKNYNKFRLGMSISLTEEVWTKSYEPKAPSPAERMDALRTAKDAGISTWISLEPIIDPLQAMHVVKLCHEFTDHWKIGKLRGESRAAIDWNNVRSDLIAYLDDVSADYYIKNSLREGGHINYKEVKSTKS